MERNDNVELGLVYDVALGHLNIPVGVELVLWSTPSRQLCRRVRAIELHLSPTGPCPTCGEATIININMTDQITPKVLPLQHD